MVYCPEAEKKGSESVIRHIRRNSSQRFGRLIGCSIAHDIKRPLSCAVGGRMLGQFRSYPARPRSPGSIGWLICFRRKESIWRRPDRRCINRRLFYFWRCLVAAWTVGNQRPAAPLADFARRKPHNCRRDRAFGRAGDRFRGMHNGICRHNAPRCSACTDDTQMTPNLSLANYEEYRRMTGARITVSDAPDIWEVEQ